MKSYLIILAFAFCFVQCKKKSTVESNYYTGTASALFNGKNWQAKAALGLQNDSFQINLDVYEKNYLRETLHFFTFPKKIGYYKLNFYPYNQVSLNPKSNYGTSKDDGDVACDSYNLDTLYVNNYIRVISLDTIEKRIVCEFAAKYLIDTVVSNPRCDSNWPNIITFTNGLIEGRY